MTNSSPTFRYIYVLIAFLVLNFGALGIGGLYTGDGVTSEWYDNLQKAPWTPPGWVFGAAWSTIMLCLSFFMASAWRTVSRLKKLSLLYGAQWILNVAWNPVFFYYRNVSGGLIVISLLTLLLIYLAVNYQKEMKWYTLLLAPYIVWLLIATSLNAYIYLNN